MSEDTEETPLLPPNEVEKAMRLTLVQAVLMHVYLALTTGVFIVGFALQLGASDSQIGLMTSIPMFCVVMQLVSSWLAQKGISRRALSFWLQLPIMFSWLLMVSIPKFFSGPDAVDKRVWTMIAVLTGGAILTHLFGNARSSWLADIVPPRRMGEFFAKYLKNANIVLAVSAVSGGALLDYVKRQGISGFNWIFLPAAIVGFINMLLLIPQADAPVKSHKSGTNIWLIVKDSFQNRALMSVIIFSAVWSMQLISGPFVPAYQLRDVGAPFFQVAVVSAIPLIMIVLTSSFWGRMVSRYGCRPILVFSTAVVAPTPLVWIWVTTPASIYYLLAPVFVIGGFAVGGVAVGMTALIYRSLPQAGRSVHYAVYAIVMTLLTAPMPALGGYLPKILTSIGINADLRCTFYASMVFIILSFFMAKRIHEPESLSTSELMKGMKPFRGSNRGSGAI